MRPVVGVALLAVVAIAAASAFAAGSNMVVKVGPSSLGRSSLTPTARRSTSGRTTRPRRAAATAPAPRGPPLITQGPAAGDRRREQQAAPRKQAHRRPDPGYLRRPPPLLLRVGHENRPDQRRGPDRLRRSLGPGPRLGKGGPQGRQQQLRFGRRLMASAGSPRCRPASSRPAPATRPALAAPSASRSRCRPGTAQSNSLLSGYTAAFNDPSKPTFHPGPNAAAPGLVVLLSTTPTVRRNAPTGREHQPGRRLPDQRRLPGQGPHPHLQRLDRHQGPASSAKANKATLDRLRGQRHRPRTDQRQRDNRSPTSSARPSLIAG